jgi:cytoskeleton protein RodZ
MPPLDTGSVTHTLRLVDPLNERAEPVASAYPNIGAYLRAVREYRGRSIPDIAAVTRVGKPYLIALEEWNLSALPSRPFAMGYVRAYARALELDEDTAAARYKAEAPDANTELQPPIGVRYDKPERKPLLLGVIALLVVGVVGWNIAQRFESVSEAPPPILPSDIPLVDVAPPSGPIALGAPTPPPAEQTTPVPYVTPGLEVGIDPATGAAASTAAVAPVMDRSAPALFSSRMPVHGVPAVGPTLVLQAKEAAALIVRGPTGEVHFARQLVQGEAYRAPIGQRLVADVTNPGAFALYINNQLQGSLALPQTPLDKAVAEVVANQPPAPAPAPVARRAPAPRAAAPVPAPQEPAPTPASPVEAPSAQAEPSLPVAVP